MGAAELEPGLLSWQARHPDWPGEDAGWGPDVTSYAVVDSDSVVMIDPLSPPAGIAGSGPAVVLLTCAWHSRSATQLAESGARVYAPQPLDGVAAQIYAHSETLPGGIEARAAFFPNEYALWIPSHRALVFAESLYGVEGTARRPPTDWFPEGVTIDDFKAWMAPLAALEPVWFLPTHGEPLANAAALLRSTLGD